MNSFQFPSKEIMVKSLHKCFYKQRIPFINRETFTDIELKSEYYIHKSGISDIHDVDNSQPIEYNRMMCYAMLKINKNKFIKKGIELEDKFCTFQKACDLKLKHKYEELLLYLHKSLELGYYPAHFAIVICYINGYGVVDEDVAAEHYLKYRQYKDDKIILGTNSDDLALYNEMVYVMHKRYIEVSEKLSNVITINGLNEIVLEYYQ